ncbi:hypothetical protein DICVIV_07369 [Dictyocaulus viviparus]|uniref:Uncharacterized protein n=1 Tax=Dictyocaulus viviparus TaxID=29172 RepID=A0A0D8XW45_DICVI|nr:hypothetical protein DICVIV_07369 [Dictyocaulus viviparus]
MEQNTNYQPVQHGLNFALRKQGCAYDDSIIQSGLLVYCVSTSTLSDRERLSLERTELLDRTYFSPPRPRIEQITVTPIP